MPGLWVKTVKSAVLVSALVTFSHCAEKPASAPKSPTGGVDCVDPNTSNVNQIQQGTQQGQQNTQQGQQNNQQGQQNFQLNNNCPDGSTGGGGVTVNGGGSQQSLCNSLKSNNSVYTAAFQRFIDKLCENNEALLTELRSESFAYRGIGNPQFKIEARTIDPQDSLDASSMQAFGSFHSQVSAEGYFELVKLKTDNEALFKQQYPVSYEGKALYDTSDKLSYEKESGNPTSGVVYEYQKDSDNDAGNVHYKARANFYTLVPGKTYVVTNIMTERIDMVFGLAAISIINAAGGYTEVIGISDQIFENGGNDNHQKAVDDARANLVTNVNFDYLQARYRYKEIESKQ